MVRRWPVPRLRTPCHHANSVRLPIYETCKTRSSAAVGSDVDETADHVMVYVLLDGSGDETGQLFVDQIRKWFLSSIKNPFFDKKSKNGFLFYLSKWHNSFAEIPFI